VFLSGVFLAQVAGSVMGWVSAMTYLKIVAVGGLSNLSQESALRTRPHFFIYLYIISDKRMNVSTYSRGCII